MVFSDKATGGAGQMRIDFDGTTVRFYVYGGYSSTNSGGLTWSGTVNGVGVGSPPGVVWSTGVKAAPGVLFGAWTANIGTQTVSFTLNHTGTSGLGGPTTHTMTITRVPPATVPGAPTAPTASAVSTTGMTLSWAIPSNGGAAIDQMLLRRWETADLTGPYVDYINAGSATSRAVTGLTPGKSYWWALYAHNSVGYSARGAVLPQATLAGMYVGKAGAFPPAAAVYVGKAGVFVPVTEIRVGKAGSFVITG